MGAFAADLEVMQDAIDQMAAFATALDERLDEVDARAARLQATWTGVASAEYGDAHRRWSHGAREMHAALEQMRQIALTAQGNYGAAIQTNRAMWP
jgi:WXG100 family type VII secretion target